VPESPGKAARLVHIGGNRLAISATRPLKKVRTWRDVPVYIWTGSSMLARVLLIVLALFAAAAPAWADARSDAREQVEFGITVAQRGLWREATLRWEQATKIDPTYAAAWNNLGIGYEQLGKFTEARKAYEKALELDRSNTYVRSNYDLFREIYDRQNRRRTP